MLIGSTILLGNFLYYESLQQQHSVEYGQNNASAAMVDSKQVIERFSLPAPQQMESVTIRITYHQIDPNVVITPTVNGRTFPTASNFGTAQTIVVEKEHLQEENRIALQADLRNSFVQEAVVASIEVTGTTQTQNYLFLGLGFLGVLVIIIPFLVLNYIRYNKRAKLEEQFPNFLRDVVEGTRAGMSLPQAIKSAENNNYGDLTPYVASMAAKLDWGIPFERVMADFAKKSQSKIIQRSISTVIQTYQAGGNVSEVLSTIGKNLKEIRQLRKQRESQVYGEMVTGYVVYFVFLVVLIVLVRYLLPALTFSGVSSGIGPIETQSLSAEEIVANYQNVFQFMVIVQSVFSGIVIGRLSEGKLGAGLKHVAILLPIGLLVTSVFM